MQSTGNKSILCVGQDNLFTGLPGCAVDHVSTGATITPFAARSTGPKRSIHSILARVCAGKYDLIVLPAIDFNHVCDDSLKKRAARGILSAALRLRPISTCINRLLSRRSTRVIVLDRYDSHETLRDFARCLTCARFYFKTNLQEKDSNQLYSAGNANGCCFKFLPYWIDVENYQVPFQREREIDVFFAGAVNSEERRASIDKVRQLESEGYRIMVEERHLPFADYLSLMSRSWLTLSPQGYGYNGFRHYESMLVGSVPLINIPDPAIVNDFRHGQNCLFYSIARADLNRIITSALSDKRGLLQMADRLREFIIDRHSRHGVGAYLLRESLADDVTDQTQFIEEDTVDESVGNWNSSCGSTLINSFAISTRDTRTENQVAGKSGA
jgi:hypothetical protein